MSLLYELMLITPTFVYVSQLIKLRVIRAGDHCTSATTRSAMWWNAAGVSATHDGPHAPTRIVAIIHHVGIGSPKQPSCSVDLVGVVTTIRGAYGASTRRDIK